MATMTSSFVDGIRTARRAWPIALVLWAWTILVAGPATLPFFTWLRGQIAYAPEGDRLLERFRFDLFAELTRSAQGPAWGALGGAIFAMVLVALAGRAFVTGGLVEALSPGSPGPWLWRFFGGGGRWFLRNLLALAITGVAAGVVAMLASMVAGVVALVVRDTSSPALAWVGLLLPLGAVAAVVVFFGIVYDYACIRIAQQQGVWHAWLTALLFVIRRLFGAIGLWLAAAVLALVVALVYLALRNVTAAASWPSILFMVVLQQLFILSRAWLRVALVAAEIRYSPPAPSVVAGEAVIVPPLPAPALE